MNAPIILYPNKKPSKKLINKSVIEIGAPISIFSSVKVWTKHRDKVLSKLCSNMVSRNLYKVEMGNRQFDKKKFISLKEQVKKLYKLNDSETDYFVFSVSMINNAYNTASDKINILFKDGKIVDIANASDSLNISVLSNPVKKYFFCYPEWAMR